jgi:COP9 signalosome complex subunit 6
MAVNISLHPLVLLNISDQFTRQLAATGVRNRTYGILVGSIKERSIHIQNSFEAPSEPLEGCDQLDLNFIQTRLGMVLQIFPTYEFLGWYSTGQYHPSDMDIQKTLTNFSENILYLNFNTTIVTSEETLPVDIYETHVTVTENSTNYEYRKAQYSIETTDSERISVDFVSKKGSGTGETSQYQGEINNFVSASRLFKGRLALLAQLVENNEKVRNDRRIMRKFNEICNRIPVSPAFNIEKNFHREINEELLVVLASVMTKGSYHLGELVDKFQKIQALE